MFRHISFPTMVLGWVAFIVICILAVLFSNVALGQSAYNPNSASARLPNTTRSLLDDEMVPGAIGSIQLQRKPQLRGAWQAVEVRGPKGVKFNFAEAGQFAPDMPNPARVGLLVGAVYRLRLTGVEGDPDLELFPTIEVIDKTCPPAEREHRFPIPIEIDENDIADAARGELVMRVIYLEDSEVAEPVDTSGKPQRVLDISASQNALRTADQLGRPVAILRMGSRVPNVTQGQDWLEFLYHCPPWTTLKPIPTKQMLIDEGRWPIIEYPAASPSAEPVQSRPVVGKPAASGSISDSQ
ncbi:MAG: hypothetical protein ACOVNQ_13215 [Pirellula sp.]